MNDTDTDTDTAVKGGVFVQRPGLRLKQLVLLIGAVYLSLIFVTNVVNLVVTLAGAHVVLFNSGNVAYIQQIAHPYGWGRGFAEVAVLGALLAEGFGALLFVRALTRYRGGRTAAAEVWTALTWNILLWLGFIVGTEVLVAYPSEAPFRELLTIGLLMAVAMAVIPDDPAAD